MKRSQSKKSKREGWGEILKKLEGGEFHTEEIGNAIVRLGKPYDEKRILKAKDVVAKFMKHPDDWVRHEAMWFIGSWGKLQEFQPALIDALRNDSAPDNRGFAALCLAHMREGTGDCDVIAALRQVVLNQQEERLVRLDCYGALLEVAGNGSGKDFYTYEKDLSDIDWRWVSSLCT